MLLHLHLSTYDLIKSLILPHPKTFYSSYTFILIFSRARKKKTQQNSTLYMCIIDIFKTRQQNKKEKLIFKIWILFDWIFFQLSVENCEVNRMDRSRNSRVLVNFPIILLIIFFTVQRIQISSKHLFLKKT